MVFVLVGLGCGGARPRGASAARAGRSPSRPFVVALLGWNLTHQPPAVHPDGGFPAGDAAARQVDARSRSTGSPGSDVDGIRIAARTSSRPRRWPIRSRGSGGRTSATLAEGRCSALGSAASTGRRVGGLVLLCDHLFRDAIGAACGGPAEDAVAGRSGTHVGPPVDRFEAAPGRWISVYGAGARRPVAATSRTPAPQTPAFAVPETRTVEGDPGRALEML